MLAITNWLAKGYHLKDIQKHNGDYRAAAPTMQDVAKRAGVSTMTVSRALKNGTSITAATRQKIMKAIEELGYVLDQSAGGLSSKRTGFVAALIPSINNSNFADTARGLTDALEGTGLQLLLAYTNYSIEKEEELIDYYEKDKNKYPKTFFFLDRGIYRPGQTVYFKGIMIKSNV